MVTPKAESSQGNHLKTPQQQGQGRGSIDKLSPGTTEFLAAVTALRQGAA